MGHFEMGTLPKEMEDVVFSLRINEISPPFESPYGYHIFKVTSRKKKRMLFYSAVKEDIKKNLLAEKLRTAYQDFLEQLKSEYKIRIFYHNLFFSYRSHQGDQTNEIE
jgi:parvulin-like peptidyl-prolyl isomerase